MNFKMLEQIAKSEASDVLEKVHRNKESIYKLLQSDAPPDYNVLIVEMLFKLSQSPFAELKLRVLLDVCNSPFIKHLKCYFIDLPETQTRNKTRNALYWQHQENFWTHFIILSECMFNMAPSVTIQTCKSLIDATSKFCLEELKKKHDFSLSEENNVKLTELRQRLLSFDETSEKQSNECKTMTESEMNDPPQDFRRLSVVPGHDDLFGSERPYLRANVVHGAYRDVEHYLDVQFRLLREDCFGPLREGLHQYKQDTQKKKFDNVCVYRDVRVAEIYTSKTNVGVMIQFDEKTSQRLKKINWNHSKRFKFGSLLLFSKDNFKTLVPATILSRDVKFLSKGKLAISVIEDANNIGTPATLNSDASYVMVESEVYFEPYQHVLRALQDPDFPRQLAMSKYIVNVNPEPKHPAYLKETSTYLADGYNFTVLEPASWPTHEQMGLNESQFEAYKLAITHEFAVIQGPPGAGKTYLGTKVAKTLIDNYISKNKNCVMLVICYTNHALDQFLEHVLSITKSIVRIGGQSRNPEIEKISLINLRKSCSTSSNSNRMFHDERFNLKSLMSELHNAQKRIDTLSNGVMGYCFLLHYIPEIRKLKQYYNMGRDDIIMQWLFENMPYVDIDLRMILNNIEKGFENIDEQESRVAVTLDDIDEELDIEGIVIVSPFKLLDAEQNLCHLLSFYKNTDKMSEKQHLLNEIRELKSRIDFFKEMKTACIKNQPKRTTNMANLSRLSNIQRWSLYFEWVNIVLAKINEAVKPLQVKVNSAKEAYEEARMNLDAHILKGTKVVGMTTSGAARLRKLLVALAPHIVIVEEAAEVLEQHIITSLTASCRHLILIGDHQQLRPSAAYLKLSRKFNIDVSLFERMILNDIHSRRLTVQHRMRPEFAALISPHIYPDLTNHPSVEAYLQMRGITSNLFFFTHDYMEDLVEEGNSRANHKEADMVLGLANYLRQQDYAPEDITILAAYTGQMFYMKKQQQRYAFLSKVKITVVDNYQGEESKIILLSLVRNNAQNKIGFLGTENRVCVALSRAKEGLYIFGNIDTLKNQSALWTNIAKTLEEQECLGGGLRLKCENHDQFTIISSFEDFQKVPEGGCLLKCNLNLPRCGHNCPLMCHGYNKAHNEIKCQLNCERIICELQHKCPLKCWEECKLCEVQMEKTLLCGHTTLVACHRDPKDPSLNCFEIVTVKLPDCGHDTEKACFVDIKNVKCYVPCIYRIDSCGHVCRRRCHVKDDPDHERYACEKPCAKAKNGCTATHLVDKGDHQCLRKCYETCDDCEVEVVKKRKNCTHSKRVPCCKDVNETPCSRKCARALPCGHFCKRKCFEKCGDCQQKVKKVIPDCNHSVAIACKDEAKRELCKRKCERILSCGHQCTSLCGQICDPTKCTKVIDSKTFQSPCGHAVKLPCNVFAQASKDNLKEEWLVKYCEAPCPVTLRCEHACAGSCARCLQGRLHVPCAQKCRATLICGHQCEEPCNQVCPPCKKQCEVKCSHSKCKKMCGAPCIPCQEKCAARCEHSACRRLCGQPCSRRPCDAPCPRRLRCGHACRGLCGEPCPPVCKPCRPDEFPRDFLGDDFPDDARFIILQDCSHILEVEDADNLMLGDSETISIRSCPFCRKPIINTYRYKDLVNRMYANEINPIKERVYGTKNQVIEKRAKLVEAIDKFKNDHIKNITAAQMVVNKLEFILKKQNNMSVLQIEMHVICLDIINRIGEYYNEYKKANLTELRDEFLNIIKFICCYLWQNINKISQQQQEDIINEMKRMNSIVQLSKLTNTEAYNTIKTLPSFEQVVTEARMEVISSKRFDENLAIIALKKLQERIKVSGIVICQEREMIVKAMGFKQGHWFKCPNGHIYCIADCGGATVISKCNECGAKIGGQSHRLLSDNSLAAEMDGASFAAWSETNNMANFDLVL